MKKNKVLNLINMNSFCFNILKIIIIFMIISVFFFFNYMNSISNKNTLKEIEVKEIENLDILYSEEEIYIYFGRSDCYSCQRLNQLIDSNNSNIPEKLYYFDTAYWDEKDISDLVCKKFNINEVPTIIKVKDGKIIDRMDLKKILNDL